MSELSNGYHISFFRPTTPQAKANRNLTLWLILIWLVAIFGFHFLMRAIEKPTPETVYIEFQNAWNNIESGNAGINDYQLLGKSTLSVLGKVFVNEDEKTVLNNALSWSVYQLTDDSLKANLVTRISGFETLKDGITDISDSTYINAKLSLTGELSPVLNLSFLDVRSKLLPMELTSEGIQVLNENTISRLPAVMSKYLVHNQSVLTDTIFLGFPFHYFYTAVFLLILFVGLCLLYCIRTDKINSQFNIID